MASRLVLGVGIDGIESRGIRRGFRRDHREFVPVDNRLVAFELVIELHLLDKLIEVLCEALVFRVEVELGRPDVRERLSGRRLVCGSDGDPIPGDTDSEEYADDRHDDHEFDEVETKFALSLKKDFVHIGSLRC